MNAGTSCSGDLRRWWLRMVLVCNVGNWVGGCSTLQQLTGTRCLWIGDMGYYRCCDIDLKMMDVAVSSVGNAIGHALAYLNIR